MLETIPQTLALPPQPAEPDTRQYAFFARKYTAAPGLPLHNPPLKIIRVRVLWTCDHAGQKFAKCEAYYRPETRPLGILYREFYAPAEFMFYREIFA